MGQLSVEQKRSRGSFFGQLSWGKFDWGKCHSIAKNVNKTVDKKGYQTFYHYLFLVRIISRTSGNLKYFWQPYNLRIVTFGEPKQNRFRKNWSFADGHLLSRDFNRHGLYGAFDLRIWCSHSWAYCLGVS